LLLSKKYISDDAALNQNKPPNSTTALFLSVPRDRIAGRAAVDEKCVLARAIFVAVGRFLCPPTAKFLSDALRRAPESARQPLTTARNRIWRA